MQTLLVQSHRGGGALAPENTLESLVASWELGLVPEADLRTTRDGVIVAFHDSTFARTVPDASPEVREKGVKDLTFKELSHLDVGAWQGKEYAGQRIRRVEEIFALLRERPDCSLYLDIKAVELPQLAELTRRYAVTPQVILAAPGEQTLRQWKALVPEAQTLLWMGMLRSGDEDTLRQRIDDLRATDFDSVTQLQIHVEAWREDEASGETSKENWHFKPSLAFLHAVALDLRSRGVLFQTLPWECGAPDVYRMLVQAGSESFASDYPEIALRILREQNDSASRDADTA